jgi:hypothetical protein
MITDDVEELREHNTEKFCAECPLAICNWRNDTGCAVGWHAMWQESKKDGSK